MPLCFDVHIVIDRRSPNVQLHRPIKECLFSESHLLKHALKLIVGIAKSLTKNQQLPFILFYRQRRRCCIPNLLRLLEGTDILISAVGICKPKLIKPQIMSHRAERIRLFQAIAEFQKNASILRDIQRQDKFSRLIRRNRRQFIRRNASRTHASTVAAQFINNVQITLHICEIQLILQNQNCRTAVIRKNSKRALYIFHFFQTTVRPTVRVYQSVHAKIAIMRILSVISAIPIHGLSVFRLALVNRVVAPLPDKASADAIVLLNQLKVVLVITCSISH